MAMICNFTKDKLQWQHVGHKGMLHPGDIKEFPDGRANHILNQLSRRGVLRYHLEDDEEALKKRAARIYNQFWVNQITTFNQQNEAAKNENRPYNHPTEILREKADEMGVDLVAPWKMQHKSESAELSAVKAENEGLKTEVTDLKKQMSDLMNLVKENLKPVKTYVDTNELIQKFNNLGKDRFFKWVIVNAEDLAAWPASVIEKAKEKWESFYPDKDWPLSEKE